MSEALSISATEFKATCLDLLDQLAEHRLTRITVTKRGRVVAVLTPPANEAQAVAALHGCMAGQVVLPPGFDLTAPVLDEPLLAEAGHLHS